jgi:succinyl-CoA synthetase beta subunit
MAAQAVGRFGGRGPTDLERHVRALSEKESRGSAMVVEIPGGDLAWMWAGGGCSMYAADACERLGGRPRTYFDATTLSKQALTEIITEVLRVPGIRGFGIGSNIRSMVRVDEEMEAIVEALGACGLDTGSFPVVARLAGPGEDQARSLSSQHEGIEFFGRDASIDDAIERLIELTEAEASLP